MPDRKKNSAQTAGEQRSSVDSRKQITLALWAIALATHLILLPMLLRELFQEYFRGKKVENRLF
jgi:hypothetical protein